MNKMLKKWILDRLEDKEYWKRHFVDPEKYVPRMFFKRVNYKLNLDNPQTYNEKLQWLKLYDHNPLYTTLVDKYEVKQYVADKIGAQYVIPTLGVWDGVDEIDISSLPKQFVLKCTHDSGGLVICKDKSKLDISKAKRLLKNSMRRNFYYMGFEWPYKNVKPRIIAEQFMVDESGKDLKDYKFFCFDGEPCAIQVDYDRFLEHKRNIYDIHWNRLPFTICYPTDWNKEIERPDNLEKMIEIAQNLSSGLPHVRVDLYNVNGCIYFGELTFYHGGGWESFVPQEWDAIFGKWLVLPANRTC